MPSSHGKQDRRAVAMRLVADGITELQQVLTRVGEVETEVLYQLADAVSIAWRADGKLLICGNGGSAADAQHIAAELVGRFLLERPAYGALALNTNSSIVTSVGNDYGFEQIFARQVTGLGRAEDVLLVISTSGNSANCVEAVSAARRIGMPVFGFLGGDGGCLRNLVDAALIVPSDSTPHIQEVHITMGHLMCHLLEEWQAGASDSPDGASDA
ncbi:MAG: SIS domain-containing protein [bacterium]